jgi:acyltransferase
MGTERNLKIDVFRGLGIMLVVLGHTAGLPAEVHRYVYSFHMPAFFILSGYLFQFDKVRRSPRSFVNGKFHRLIIPAWCMGAVCGLAFVAKLLLHRITLAAFLGLAWGSAVGFPRADGNFLSTPLWFLFCLFSLETAAACLARFVGKAMVPVLMVIGVAGIVGEARLPFVPFDLDIATSAAFFFSIGHVIRRKRRFDFHENGSLMRRAILLFSVAVVWAVLTYRSGDALNMSDSVFGSSPLKIVLDVAAALAGTLMLGHLCVVLPDVRLLRWLGTHTLPILGFNYLVSATVVRALDAAHANHWLLSFVIQSTLLAAVAWAIDRTGVAGDLINGRRRQVRPEKPAGLSQT